MSELKGVNKVNQLVEVHHVIIRSLISYLGAEYSLKIDNIHHTSTHIPIHKHKKHQKIRSQLTWTENLKYRSGTIIF